MKLWLLRKTQGDYWGAYHGAVVAAETEDEARNMHPGGGSGGLRASKDSGWVSDASHVSVRLIGEAVNGIERGVLLADHIDG